MAIHTIERTDSVNASLAECWTFFSDPRNLKLITPPELGFEVLTVLPPKMHAGLMIQYTVRPLLGIPMTWLTEITHVEEQVYFVDEQRIGPYRVWHHEHWFTEEPDGTVEMRDRVHYVMPFGPLGDLVHPFLVRGTLEKIFDFRTTAVKERFPSRVR